MANDNNDTDKGEMPDENPLEEAAEFDFFEHASAAIARLRQERLDRAVPAPEGLRTDEELGIRNAGSCISICDHCIGIYGAMGLSNEEMDPYIGHDRHVEEVLDDGSVLSYDLCQRTGRKSCIYIRKPVNGMHQHGRWGSSTWRMHPVSRKHRINTKEASR